MLFSNHKHVLDLNIPIKKQIWKIAAVGLGIISSILIIHIMQFINIAFYPMENTVLDFDASNYADFIRTNTLFLIGILFSNFTGSFFGGAISKLTHPTVTILSAGWVGVVLLGLDLYNLLSVDYPLWFWLLSIIIYIPAAWFGAFAVTFTQNRQIEVSQ